MAAIGYENVGTVEFMVDADGQYYFLEMNTRLQVEHPVTELVTGIDLVKLQIALAAGEPLPFKQQDVVWRGHAIECRVTSEDPARGFAPDAGHIHTAHFPGGPWVRVDTHVFPGYTTPPYYDSLLAKIVVWGRDRSEALARMRRAIDETQIDGVQTNLDYLALVLSHPRFEAGEIDVDFVERHLAEMQPLDGRVTQANAAGATELMLERSVDEALEQLGRIFPRGPVPRSSTGSGTGLPGAVRDGPGPSRPSAGPRAVGRGIRRSAGVALSSRGAARRERLRAGARAGMLANRAAIDGLIQLRAPLWPLAQMSAVDRNVLRIGLYESLYGNATVPLRTAINEAVELAKLFGSETSAKFVNGVLGRAVEASASGEWPPAESSQSARSTRTKRASRARRRSGRTCRAPARH